MQLYSNLDNLLGVLLGLGVMWGAIRLLRDNSRGDWNMNAEEDELRSCLRCKFRREVLKGKGL